MTPTERHGAPEDFIREWKLATLLAMSPPPCVDCHQHPAASAEGRCKRCGAKEAA